MPLNNNIDDLEPDLALVYAEAKADWKRDYPEGPWPELNETARSKAVQDAYYARTRKPVAEVQRLYKLAGLYAIEAEEAATWATNATFGQSAHNARADEYSDALDVRMRLLVLTKAATASTPAIYKAGKQVTWESRYFTAFGGYMIKASSRLYAAKKTSDKVVWGGDWNANGNYTDDRRPDLPHFERKSWRLGRRKKPVAV
jgi:hypothetical protein